MDRRDIFKLAVAAGAGVLVSGAANEAAAQQGKASTKRMPSTVTTRDGAALFVRDWGAGPPVVFLSGWTLCSDFWNYQMSALSGQGLRCFSYDRRGHGRSSDPGGGYDFDTLAADLAAVLNERDLRGVTLVAHSMASGEVARYVAKNGEKRIAGIVLVGQTTPCLMKRADNPAGIDRAVLEALRVPIAKDFPQWIAANAAPFFTPETSPAMIEWGKSLMLKTSMQAVIECNRAMVEADFRGDLAKVTVPTLMIHGDKDASAPLPLTASRSVEIVKGSRLVVYEGAPHGLPLTHVDRLNGDIRDFIRSTK